jgi:hypothetical protein
VRIDRPPDGGPPFNGQSEPTKIGWPSLTPRQFRALMERWRLADADARRLLGLTCAIGNRPRLRLPPAHQRTTGCLAEIVTAAEPIPDFPSVHALIHARFHPGRRSLAARSYRAIRIEAFNVWMRSERCRTGMRNPRVQSAGATKINMTMPSAVRHAIGIARSQAGRAAPDGGLTRCTALRHGKRNSRPVPPDPR